MLISAIRQYGMGIRCRNIILVARTHCTAIQTGPMIPRVELEHLANSAAFVTTVEFHIQNQNLPIQVNRPSTASLQEWKKFIQDVLSTASVSGDLKEIPFYFESGATKTTLVELKY